MHTFILKNKNKQKDHSRRFEIQSLNRVIFWKIIQIFRSIRDFTRGDNTGVGPVRITPLKTSTAKPKTTVEDDHDDDHEDDHYKDEIDDHEEDDGADFDDEDHEENHKKKDKSYEDEEDEEARRHRRKIRRQKRKKKLEKENKRKIQRDLGMINSNEN